MIVIIIKIHFFSVVSLWSKTALQIKKIIYNIILKKILNYCQYYHGAILS